MRFSLASALLIGGVYLVVVLPTLIVTTLYYLHDQAVSARRCRLTYHMAVFTAIVASAGVGMVWQLVVEVFLPFQWAVTIILYPASIIQQLYFIFLITKDRRLRWMEE